MNDKLSYEERLHLEGFSEIPFVGSLGWPPFKNNTLMIRYFYFEGILRNQYGKQEYHQEYWVSIIDGDDWELRKQFPNMITAKEFMTKLPSFIDWNWLNENGFE